jgi:hypothetical protein
MTDLPVILIIGAYVAVTIALHAATGIPASVDLPTSWSWLLRASLLYLVPAAVIVTLRVAADPGRRLLDLGEWGRHLRRAHPGSRLVGFALLCALLPIWMHAFLRFKVAIPVIHPFSMDELFMRADRLLHFGFHPFELLQPLLGQPAMTQLIDIIYYTWFFAIWITFVWQALHGSGVVRSQFLMAFSLCWILLGTVAAILLSSAGPVYFAAVTGAPDPYQPLLHYLESVDREYPLMALRVRDMLWQAYSGVGIQRAGISAMPSLHISMVVLMTIVGFRVKPAVGIAFAVFALFTFLGSIHLGWHYAIDGYVSLIATALIWRLSGRIVRWWQHTSGLPATAGDPSLVE